ncbi:MAG: hypothetical protein NC116_09035 [Clostridium sp.]|nr:hypothetical protein [Bacteroidales bacterium]MCM1510844.1 hypothetical protein [Clostridium sp.]
MLLPHGNSTPLMTNTFEKKQNESLSPAKIMRFFDMAKKYPQNLNPSKRHFLRISVCFAFGLELPAAEALTAHTQKNRAFSKRIGAFF